MKLPCPITRVRRAAGMMLIECLVYIAVFAVLLGIGTGAFYYCWDHTRAVIGATDDIAAALRAGEGWRADVRAATGRIVVETTPAGDVVRIPEKAHEVVYRFASGEVRREIPALKTSRRLLPKVNAFQMLADTRGPVNAWRWELELAGHPRQNLMPLRFTFEAVPANP